VGFEPTWLSPIRFRDGAVMTASVPLLKYMAVYSICYFSSLIRLRASCWLASEIVGVNNLEREEKMDGY
jgi:hypothetical protein